MSIMLLKQISLATAMMLCTQPLLSMENTDHFQDFQQVNINGPQVYAQQQLHPQQQQWQQQWQQQRQQQWQQQRQQQWQQQEQQQQNGFSWMNPVPQNQVIHLQPQYNPISMPQNQPVAMPRATFPGNHLVAEGGINVMPQQQIPLNPLKGQLQPGLTQESEGMKRKLEQDTAKNTQSQRHQNQPTRVIEINECSITDIPSDVLYIIYSYLNPVEFVHGQQVCEAWHKLFNKQEANNLWCSITGKTFLSHELEAYKQPLAVLEKLFETVVGLKKIFNDTDLKKIQQPTPLAYKYLYISKYLDQLGTRLMYLRGHKCITPIRAYHDQAVSEGYPAVIDPCYLPPPPSFGQINPSHNGEMEYHKVGKMLVAALHGSSKRRSEVIQKILREIPQFKASYGLPFLQNPELNAQHQDLLISLGDFWPEARKNILTNYYLDSLLALSINDADIKNKRLVERIFTHHRALEWPEAYTVLGDVFHQLRDYSYQGVNIKVLKAIDLYEEAVRKGDKKAYESLADIIHDSRLEEIYKTYPNSRILARLCQFKALELGDNISSIVYEFKGCGLMEKLNDNNSVKDFFKFVSDEYHRLSIKQRVFPSYVDSEADRSERSYIASYNRGINVRKIKTPWQLINFFGTNLQNDEMKVCFLHYITHNILTDVRPDSWIDALITNYFQEKWHWDVRSHRGSQNLTGAMKDMWSPIDTWMGHLYFSYHGDKMVKRNFYQKIIPICLKKGEKDNFLMLYGSYCRSTRKEEKVHKVDYDFLSHKKLDFEKKFEPDPELLRLFNGVKTRYNDQNLPMLPVGGHQSLGYSTEYMAVSHL